jgi:UDP-N-acetylmuramate--alanine ligase
MRPLPLDLGMIHFVGIGGIGMSGLAEILNNLGYQVQGSDVAANANVQRLRGLGIEITVGHAAENVEAAQVVVVSSAIKDDNPEVAAARQRLIPVVRRAEMLAELMRIKWSVAVGGTHGKTTTTSMIAALLDAAHMDPTVINGGIINAYGTNARLGAGDWMVVEADESDGSFVKLPATIAVVTNIDPEHMEFYGSLEALHDAFEAFVENIPFYGVAILCIDHPVVQTLMGRIADRRIVTYGLSSQADVRALNLAATGGVTRFDVALANRVDDKVRTLERPGRIWRRQAALHQDRRSRRNHGDRRLRAPPGGDHRGVGRGAARHQRPGDRRGPAAPLYPARRPLRRVLYLLQRRRPRYRGRSLPRRRSPDRGRQSRHLGRGPARQGASKRRLS